MNDPLRISEVTGIRAAHAPESGPVWPLNLVLLVLGAAILGVAFHFLDVADTRLLYNPWTYAIANPLVLMGLSALLSTLVSQVVEKSMQLAFLLSVLIHLVLLVGATNVVLYSRAWPDMLEALDQQRQDLQRPRQHAPLYHRPGASKQRGGRPDYLQPVATVHGPTDMPLERSASGALAPSDREHWPSPEPRHALTHTPSLQPREPSSEALLSSPPTAASLSRSRLDVPGSAAEGPPPAATEWEAESPAALAPAATQVRRQASSGASATALPSPPPLVVPGESRQGAGNAGAVALLAPGRSGSRPSPLGRTPQLPLAAPVQLPTSGAMSLEMPKATAGGTLGAAAPSSMPVQGLDALGAVPAETPAPPRLESVVTDQRRKSADAAVTRLPMPGTIAAPTWSGTPTLSGGTQGQSPSPLARAAGDGTAAVADPARLTGSDRDLQRTTLGQPPLPGTDGQVTELTGNATQPELNQSAAPLSAAATALSRDRSSVAGPLLSNAPAGPRDLPSQSAVANALQDFAGAPSPLARPVIEPPTAALSGRDLPKQATVSSAGPPPTAVDTGLVDSSYDGPPPLRDSLPEAEPARLSRRTADARRGDSATSAARPLAIEAPLGTGGIAPSVGELGDLLARRDLPLDRVPQPPWETQPLARQQFGGPLAAGQRVALPTPAFQQRIDRLKEPLPGTANSELAPQTELAIERGLEFLARHQRPDGSWRLQDFDTPVLMRSDTAATGLALLAFQGAGYTHTQFKHAETVARGLNFLARNQASNGDLYIPQDPASDQNAWLYSHAMAALALCEAHGMTQDERLRPVAQRAIDFMVASQDPRRGGWRYRPGVGADTSVTGWFMLALKSGQLSGLNVPRQTMQGIESYLLFSQSPAGDSHLYRYNPFAADTPQQRHGLSPTPVMTSVGLLMRLYFGWTRERGEMQAGADYLLRYLPENGSPEASRRDTYYWYYATQLMFHMRGRHWQQWHDRLYPLLIDSQVTQGELAGSWDPNLPTPDLWAHYGGRLYVTTLNLLSLEVSYRHLPLYEAPTR